MARTPLPQETFEQLVTVAETESKEAAASLLMAHFKGDVRKAETALWDTYDFLLGGEPGRRPTATEHDEGADFCGKLVTIIAEKREIPFVPRVASPAIA